MSNGNDMNWSEERTRFGILIIVMIGIVLVVAISRPLIFGHIIPVILGEGAEFTIRQAELEPPVRLSPDAAETDNLDQEDSEIAAPEAETAAPEQGAQAVEPTTAETEVTDEGATAADAATTETERDSASSATHVVKTGETLTSIAEQYGVTVSALVTANDLITPNRIRIGDILTIPEP